VSRIRLVLCVLVAGLTLLAIGTVFHFTIRSVAPSLSRQFDNAALYRPWPGWTSTYMLLHPLGYGVVFALVYAVLWLRGFEGWQGGLKYGAGVFVVGSLPVYLLAFASFEVSPEVIAWWIAQSASQYLAAGVAIGAVAGRAEQPARETRSR
jgi:hypothetical protein